MDIKERSYARCYDFNQVILTQDDAMTQIVRWHQTSRLVSAGSSEWCKCIAKVAFWKTVVEHQIDAGVLVGGQYVAQ